MVGNLFLVLAFRGNSGIGYPSLPLEKINLLHYAWS